MNDVEFNFNDYKFGANAISRKYKLMIKNEKINIKALQNGYLVEHSWRERSRPPVLR